MTTNRTAFVLGATGAVGRCLVECLVECHDFTRVILFGRRLAENLPASDKIEQKIVDFDNIEKYADDFKGLDVGFCALGTTRSQSTPEQFYKIEHDYVVNTAKLAKEQGCKEFVLVTSWGTDENSRIMNARIKGISEKDVTVIGFDKFLIVRPAFLEGRNRDFRITECIAAIFMPVVKLFTDKMAVPCVSVAKSMIVGVRDDTLQGKAIWENPILINKASLYVP